MDASTCCDCSDTFAAFANLVNEFAYLNQKRGGDFGRYSFCLTGLETRDSGVLFHGNHIYALYTAKVF